jgi:hypothetical protein
VSLRHGGGLPSNPAPRVAEARRSRVARCAIARDAVALVTWEEAARRLRGAPDITHGNSRRAFRDDLCNRVRRTGDNG